MGKSEKLKKRGFLSVGFLTRFGVWLSDLGQSRRRPNGLLRFPIQKAGRDCPHIHTHPALRFQPPGPQGTGEVSCLVYSWALPAEMMSLHFAQARS